MSLPAASYLTSSSPTWVAGRALLACRGFELFACWSRTGRGLDYKTIRELHIASRTVRECVLLFAPCYHSGDIRRLSRKLNRLTERLGAIINIDETLLFMELILEELSPLCRESLTHVMSHLCRERENEAIRVGKFLRKTRRLSLAALFKELNIAPDLFGDGTVNPFMPVRRYLHNTLRQTLCALAPLAAAGQCETTREAWKSWRAGVKNLHSLLEVVTPIMIKGPPDGLLVIIESYGELLGTLHDLHRFRELVEKLITDGETREELTGIITVKQSRVRIKLTTLLDEQPWQRLLARIEECL